MVASGIARLWKPVINVTDLDEGERFWSAVSGLDPLGRIHDGTFSVLAESEDDVDGRDGSWILLQQVPAGQRSTDAGTHLDFRVDDVADAQRRIEAIGGTVVSPAGPFPDATNPVLEWAVLADPFDNEFCIIRWPL